VVTLLDLEVVSFLEEGFFEWPPPMDELLRFFVLFPWVQEGHMGQGEKGRKSPMSVTSEDWGERGRGTGDLKATLDKQEHKCQKKENCWR
jgi:hypothetical protein